MTDDGARAVTDDTVLAVVTDNYQRCTRNADQLTALQEWATGIQRIGNEH